MSLIRRRKSPGWGLGSTPRPREKTFRSGKKVKIPIVKKILNPLSGRKINFNGPKHKELIEEGILDADGVDIRSKKTTPKKTKPTPKSTPKSTPKKSTPKSTPKKSTPKSTPKKPTPKKPTPKSTPTINTENLLINYVIKDGRLTYELMDVIVRTKEIVVSRVSGKDKQHSMVKVFADFRYNNDSEIKKKVDSLFSKIKYNDLLKDLIDIYNFYKKKKSKLSVKYREKLKDYSFRKHNVVGIELGELFADLRYRRNEKAKFEIINKVLSLTKSLTKNDKEQGAFEFINTGNVNEAQTANLRFNYYFNQKIPLTGDYIFKNDYEIINKMIEQDEDVFLIYLVFANLEKLKEKDLGLLNRLARYIEHSPKKITSYARTLLDEIKKATDYSLIEEIDVMTFVRRAVIKIARKEGVNLYRGDMKEINEYLEKLKKNKPGVYEKLLKEYVITYDPTKDTIASFLETMRVSNEYSREEDYHYSPKFNVYPYLKFVKKKGEWRDDKLPGMLVSDDGKRKMVINRIVDYYEKKYNIDEVEAMEYLKEDLEKLKPDETLFHVRDEIKKYPKHYQTFTDKLNKDLTYLESQIKNIKKFKHGAVGYLETKQDFEQRQK